MLLPTEDRMLSRCALRWAGWMGALALQVVLGFRIRTYARTASDENRPRRLRRANSLQRFRIPGARRALHPV